jgi:epoxyqueuosine reductase
MMTEKAVSKDPTSFVLEKARKLGFAAVGVTGIEPPDRYAAYESWLDRGDHGDMKYMDEDIHRKSRFDLRELLPEAQSAVVVALSYPKAAPDGEHASTKETPRGRVAQYALGDDYHHHMHGKLKLLAEALTDFVGRPLRTRSCVDSAPLLERELAERAGLGFVAKNTMLISPGIGSYTLLGVLLCELPLQPTVKRETRDCGTCTACLDACPTQAFRAPYQLDAKRCISYLTIENSGPVPEELRSKMGDRIFGCDVCQDVCPYNAKAPLRNEGPAEMQARERDRARPPLHKLATLGSNQRKRYLQGSAMRRVGRDALLRNVAVALGNQEPSESTGRLQTLKVLLEDRSEMVREHAQWACEQTAKGE